MDPADPKPEALNDETRARLFALLSELDRPAPTDELAERVGLHVNGVRRQLERMHEAGLLERQQVVRGRGRPRDEWSVAVGAAPSNPPPSGYADLARWLARSISPGRRVSLRAVERAGREIGREIAPPPRGDAEAGFELALASLGFRPRVEPSADGFDCRLGNCPYRDSARENPDLICTLHRGITLGLLERLAPDAQLTRFEPHDPDAAGCLIAVSAGTAT